VLSLPLPPPLDSLPLVDYLTDLLDCEALRTEGHGLACRALLGLFRSEEVGPACRWRFLARGGTRLLEICHEQAGLEQFEELVAVLGE
jgi:hypothetical protein